MNLSPRSGRSDPTPGVASALRSLDRAVYLHDRAGSDPRKVRAFMAAAAVVSELGEDELQRRARSGTISELTGIGASTGEVITSGVLGVTSPYLDNLERSSRVDPGAGGAVRAQLLGDLHTHSRWSDGGATIDTMARTAADLGHSYLAVTDHSPRLTVAHGLNEARLGDQLAEIAVTNMAAAPLRILTGIEVDILEDGSLDHADAVLARLDVVVASVHSKLAMPSAAMTRRLIRAVASPHVDVLGHCTGRLIAGTGRTPSQFDADMVFAACARFDTAVELNCRPERRDPPDELVRLAVEWGCKFAINSDAHAPGQLEWVGYGCERVAELGVAPESIVNTWPVDDLLAWTAAHPVT